MRPLKAHAQLQTKLYTRVSTFSGMMRMRRKISECRAHSVPHTESCSTHTDPCSTSTHSDTGCELHMPVTQATWYIHLLRTMKSVARCKYDVFVDRETIVFPLRSKKLMYGNKSRNSHANGPCRLLHADKQMRIYRYTRL